MQDAWTEVHEREKNAYNERHQNIRMKFYAENHVHIDQY